MKVTERAAQIWPLLAWAATNRQILTYEIVGKLTGAYLPGIGQLLEPIQSYCLVHELPPLTAIVVSKETGLPGLGFIAAANIPRTQGEVFAYDWLGRSCPTEEEFRTAVTERPSNGNP